MTTESGWFAARPSGTEDVYKIYAESFRGPDHLAELQTDARRARVTSAGSRDMRITLLSHDISDNGLGRAHVLARLLCTDHEVEIIGPAANRRDLGAAAARRCRTDPGDPDGPDPVMAGQADGDLLYSVKERPTSLGVALAARKVLPTTTDRRRRRLGAGLSVRRCGGDDGAAGSGTRPSGSPARLTDVRQPNNIYRTAWTEQQVRRADAVTVRRRRWLAKRFKGTVIEHSRDTSALDPSRVDGTRPGPSSASLPETTLILFMGSPRRHKGLHNVVAALDACSTGTTSCS